MYRVDISLRYVALRPSATHAFLASPRPARGLASPPLTSSAGPGILNRVPGPAAEFSSSAILPTLRAACDQAGLSSVGAELLRLGQNAIYQLAAAPIVVRIARTADRLPRVENELCIAQWLDAAGVLAVRVLGEIDQPLLVDGHPISFWHTVTGRAASPARPPLPRILPDRLGAA